MQKTPIKAVVVDIDGCLNAATIGEPIDLQPLHILQQYSLKSLHDPAIPAFILNTGRSLNFTEVFAEILGSRRYFLFESGAAMGRVQGSRTEVIEAPQITSSSKNKMMELRDQFLFQYPQYVTLYQVGKLYMFTFVSEINSPVLKNCARDLAVMIKQGSYPFKLDVGYNFINVMYPNIDKGTGLDFLLSHEKDLKLECLAGIGDSESDWAFMSKCAFRACPINGRDNLKKQVDMVATRAEAPGVVEIVEQIIKTNRNIMRSD